MRTLVLTKRHYTGKDLLKDRYGRMWELPEKLVKIGHQVVGVALSYRSTDQPISVDPKHADLQWHAHELAQLPSYFRKVKRLIDTFHPNLIWAGSDAPHIVFAERFARTAQIPFVADLYDNFASFPATRYIPGLASRFSTALSNASGISCVSAPLQKKTSAQLPDQTIVQTIENAIDPELFKPEDKKAARTSLGLPHDSLIIGTAGALKKGRGIFVLCEACDRLCEEGQSVCLLVAGQRDRSFRPPRKARLVDLGEVPQKQVPTIFNALDVGVIANLDSAFGRYCFPMKLYEMMACQIPVAVAAVGAPAELLKTHPQCLFNPGDAGSLARVIQAQLEKPCVPKIEQPTWTEQAIRLSLMMEQAIDLYHLGRA